MKDGDNGGDEDRSQLIVDLTQNRMVTQIRWGSGPLKGSGTVPTMVQVTRWYHMLTSGLGKGRQNEK